MACNGNCTGCGGCGKELVLTEKEIGFLRELGQFAFLTIARQVGDATPRFPEKDTEEMSLVLQCLEKKGLISLDFDRPLVGGGNAGAEYPIVGSVGLTERGQTVLELMEYQGIQPEI